MLRHRAASRVSRAISLSAWKSTNTLKHKDQPMPAKSKDQQKFMGAELQRKREGKPTKTDMGEEQLSDFASTKRKNLPKKVRGKK